MKIELSELAGPEGGDESHRRAKFWNGQIEKVFEDRRYTRWLKRGHSIEKRYRDERSRTEEDGVRRYNALWSNVQILTPAVFGRCPTPIAERRFKDKDPVGRGAAQILERGLRNEVEICGFEIAVQQAVQDYLLPGRGTVWVRYEPEIEEGVSVPPEGGLDMEDQEGELEPTEELDEAEDLDKLQDTGDQIVRESTPVDYVNWEDFLIFPSTARTWAEVTAIAKRVFMNFENMKERFGRDIAKDIPLNRDERRQEKFDAAEDKGEVKGEIFEIWNKNDKRVYWVAEGYDFLCDMKEDPLNLEYFFPCPRPLFANSTTGTLIPVPDYLEYQDQAIQIDELTQRIAMLTRACKVAGVYDASAKALSRLLNESVENELIPVDSWATFAEKGGVAGAISMLPLKEVIGVLNELTSVKERLIEEMDRLTGINDIMRGTSDARETLGGVRLKSNSTGTRLQARQNEVARFCRDTIRIMADIMCQHFSPQSLIECSGALYEEGLGPEDMPSLTQFQASLNPPVAAQPSGLLQGPAPQGPAPSAAALNGAGPTMPQQGNVVPFPRPPQPQAPLNGEIMPPGAGMPQPVPMQPSPPMQPQQPQGGKDPQTVMAALVKIAKSIQLLRDERQRGFRIEIETDSTVYADSAQEKQDRTEFIGSVTKYLQTAMQMAQAMPQSTPLLGKLLQFGVRGFRVGRDLESAIEEFCDEAMVFSKQLAEKQATQKNPEQIKAEAMAQKAQTDAQSAKLSAQADAMKVQGDLQSQQMDQQTEQQKAQAELERQELENRGEQANSQADMMMKAMEVRMKEMEIQIEKLRAKTEIEKIKNPPEPERKAV